jgi:hypothetical protein
MKDGTKIILFATEDTSVTLVIGQLWMSVTIKNLMALDNLMREVVPNKFINLTLNNGTMHQVKLLVSFSNFCCGISTVFYGGARRRHNCQQAAKEKGSIRKDGFIVSVPGFVR